MRSILCAILFFAAINVEAFAQQQTSSESGMSFVTYILVGFAILLIAIIFMLSGIIKKMSELNSKG